ncbi:MAG: hypothetical protein HC844_18225 [Tabrizicola sp.]|nr:hypothetical protein [Tabrizicola sp.]
MTLDPFKAIEKTLGINPRAARIVAGGFLVLIVGISAYQLVGDKTVTFWQMLAALVGLMLLMIVLSQMPVAVGRLCGWVVGLCFTVWACALTAQVVANDQLPIAPSKCLAYLGFAESCGRSRASAGTSVAPEAIIAAAGGEESSIQPVPTAETSPGDVTRRLTLEEQEAAAAEAEAAPPSPDPGAARVFIQFAGFKREDVITLALALSGQGWQIEAAEKGGERTGAADGLNEVRYFHADDRARAEALALSVSAGLPGQPPIAVKDLSGTEYGQAEPGLLEVWVSEGSV